MKTHKSCNETASFWSSILWKGTTCTRNCSNNVFKYHIFILLLFVITGARANCKFPKYLETNAIWMTHNENGKLNKGYFQGSFMRASRCDGGNCYEYQRKCLSKREDNKFEVQHTNMQPNNQAPMYLCMQILRRSDSVIQIRESSELYYRSPNACNDVHLILDNWPMVTSEKFDQQKIPCPFVGGYNIRFHSSNNVPKCAKEIIPPRLESECESGDGMTINFQSEACQDTALKMEKVQDLYCTANWTNNNFTFIILRPQNGEFKAWCMRVRGTDMQQRVERGDIFMQFVCDPGDGSGAIRETTSFLSIEFEQRIISSTCSDSYGFCDDSRLCPQKVYDIHCRKFCNFCTGDPSPCVFPAQLQGNWVEKYKQTEQSVDVSFYSLHFKDGGNFRCHEKEEHDFANDTLLLQTFDNGCFPRYACLEVWKRAPSVLQYRIGNRVGWPINNWNTLRDDVCSTVMYRANAEDKAMFGKEVEEKPLRNLVDSLYHFPVDCGLSAVPMFRETKLLIQEEGTCDYCLIHDPLLRPKRVTRHPINCTDPKLTTDIREYNCLGVYPHDEKAHAVITRTLHLHQEYLCWLFIKENDREEREGTIYVTDASICGSAAIEGLKTGSITPIKTYFVSKQPRGCPYIPETENEEMDNSRVLTHKPKTTERSRINTPSTTVRATTKRPLVTWLPATWPSADRHSAAPRFQICSNCFILSLFFLATSLRLN